MKPGFAAIACLLLTLTTSPCLGQKPASPDWIRDQKVYQQAYEQGIKEADQELQRGNPTIYVWGYRSLFEYLDRETGLPYHQFGCDVSDKIFGLSDGHNARIHESIQQTGPPAHSFRRWDKELFDLKAYCATPTPTNTPHRLTPGGPPLTSPDGRCTIRPVQTSFTKDDGTQAIRLGLALNTDGFDLRVATVFPGTGETDLIWAPPGAPFAILRTHRGDKTTYEALDLDRARRLRMEF